MEFFHWIEDNFKALTYFSLVSKTPAVSRIPLPRFTGNYCYTTSHLIRSTVWCSKYSEYSLKKKLISPRGLKLLSLDSSVDLV